VAAHGVGQCALTVLVGLVVDPRIRPDPEAFAAVALHLSRHLSSEIPHEGGEHEQIAVAGDDPASRTWLRKLMTAAERVNIRERIDQLGEIGSGYDLEKLLLGDEGFEQTAAPLDHKRRHAGHRLPLERRADKDVRVENDPHPGKGSASF
jgi:hypothetical protein